MWLAVVGLSQVVLAAAAIWLFILPTQIGFWPASLLRDDMPLRGFGPILSQDRDVYYYGYPIPWSECHQEATWSVEIVGNVLESQEVSAAPRWSMAGTLLSRPSWSWPLSACRPLL